MALANFNHQIQFALQHYKPHGRQVSEFKNIIIAGLGGSGIGGRIARSYFLDKSPIPIEVYSDYHLPAYADKNSLLILSSYSGLTEETLAMFEEAVNIGAGIICITSGGTLKELAETKNLPYYIVEQGYQPRMALGFSLTYNLLIISELLGMKETPIQLEGLKSIYENTEVEKSLAKEMIEFFKNSLKNKYVIVADGATEAVGIRFCQQIQENAKAEAFISVLPEANHNAFETYYGKLPTNFIFLNSRTHERNNGRFDYLKELLDKQGNKVFELKWDANDIHHIYKTIHNNDWFSIYLSNELGADNMSVPNISGLKDFLLRMTV